MFTVPNPYPSFRKKIINKLAMDNMTKCGSIKAYWTHPDTDPEQFASNAAFVISAITFFTNLVINAFILSCPELRKIVSQTL